MKITNQRIIKLIFPIFILTLSIFFFFGGPYSYSARSFQAVWNLGHILFFSLLPLVLFYFKKIPNKFSMHSALALALALILGAGVELAQSSLIGREPDLYDFFRDLIGALLCISFFLPSRKSLPKPALTVIQSCTLVLIVFQIQPLINALHDEHLARKQFPLLCGFETRHEIDRWWAATQSVTVDQTVHRTGKASMRVVFDTRKYAMVELAHFPRNWEGFSFLEFSVYNPSAEEIQFRLSIHDDDPSETGSRYKDRFKGYYRISKGWHTYRVNLERVRQYPKNRLINMQKIMGVGFYTIKLPHPRAINLDDIRLIK